MAMLRPSMMMSLLIKKIMRVRARAMTRISVKVLGVMVIMVIMVMMILVVKMNVIMTVPLVVMMNRVTVFRVMGFLADPLRFGHPAEFERTSLDAGKSR